MSHRHPVPPSEPPTPDQRGFVLGLVVLFLFAIAVGATAGYQMVNSEFTISQSARDGQQALVVARAGLERFLADQIGDVGDSVRYQIGRGEALVTSRVIYQKDAENHLYYIESEGTVRDDRVPDDPARRIAGTYAWHRIAPLPHVATIFITDRTLRVEGTVDGTDSSTSTECAGGGTSGVYGVATGGTVYTANGGVLTGYPSGADHSYTGYSDVVSAMQLRWDILTDPGFPVDFDGTPPSSWGDLPADSFPISRHYGDLLPDHTSGWSGGRGVLVVTGRIRAEGGFTWDGLILAGRLDRTLYGDSVDIEGMIFAGMNGEQRDEELVSGVFQYNYCRARAANESLSYLEPLEHAVYEIH